MRIAIVEDNPADAEKLKLYLLKYMKNGEEKWTIRHYCDAAAFLKECDDFSLVIMDIDMPGISGIEAARKLRERDKDTVLMFMTNMPQYALQGYAVDAIDYVIKPVSYQDFALKMKKAERYIRSNSDQSILLMAVTGIVKISILDIVYVESSLHYITYHMKDGQNYRVRGKLSQAEEKLPRGRFSRCNNSYLVNLRCVEAVEKEDVLAGGHRLKISRGRRKDFLKDLTQYLGGGKE